MKLALFLRLFSIIAVWTSVVVEAGAAIPETAAAQFLRTPSNPSYAVEGQDLSLVWTYTLDGNLTAVLFSNVTGRVNDFIGVRLGLGKINSTQKYEARFRAQATSTRAELMILAVQLSDEATYQLNLVSSKLSSIIHNVKVIVQSPASNIVTSSDQTITAPAELTLNCSADGKPTPTITWTKVFDNTVVTMPLNITRGKTKESYRCTADNGVGNPLTKDVIVNILFAPKVTLARKVFVRREESTSLYCEVEGNPTPTISWSPCYGQSVVCDEQYLNISKVQTARANYTCTATNALAVDSATTLLLIGGKNVYLRLSINEECDSKDTVWKALQEELDKVFAKTTSYSGAELIHVRCGSLIFDVVFKFSIVVAEDEILSIIQNAAANGKLRKLLKCECII